MRIISGTLKGRIIKDYKINGTRPTMDRVKESIFSSIQNYVKDSICLDLFAGTGNLGIEAISNGACMCYFVDRNKVAINTITKNLELFNIKNKSIVLNNDYMKALKYFSNPDIKFDIIFLDPPYKDNIITNIIDYVYCNQLLNKSGIIICEYDDNELDTEKIKFKLLKYKKYGSKKVSVYINEE